MNPFAKFHKNKDPRLPSLVKLKGRRHDSNTSWNRRTGHRISHPTWVKEISSAPLSCSQSNYIKHWLQYSRHKVKNTSHISTRRWDAACGHSSGICSRKYHFSPNTLFPIVLWDMRSRASFDVSGVKTFLLDQILCIYL